MRLETIAAYNGNKKLNCHKYTATKIKIKAIKKVPKQQ